MESDQHVLQLQANNMRHTVKKSGGDGQRMKKLMTDSNDRWGMRTKQTKREVGLNKQIIYQEQSGQREQ